MLTKFKDMKNFAIFDVNKPLLSNYDIIEADKPIEAAKKYCDNNYKGKTPKRSGSNYVQISTQQIILRDGVKYRKGNQTWYELN